MIFTRPDFLHTREIKKEGKRLIDKMRQCMERHEREIVCVRERE